MISDWWHGWEDYGDEVTKDDITLELDLADVEIIQPPPPPDEARP